MGTISGVGGFLAIVETGVGGFLLGYLAASLRNWRRTAYAVRIQRRAAAKIQRSLLNPGQ
jgi:hypothetical protein